MELRRGRIDDFSKAIVDLIWSEDPAVMVAEFETMEVFASKLAVEWSTSGTANSFETALLAWEGEQLVGFSSSFPAQEVYPRFIASDELRRKNLTPTECKQLDERMQLLDRIFFDPAEDAYYVLDLSVRDGMQGRGVGRALLSAAVDEGRRHGCSHLCLDVYAENEAVAFYRKFGLQVEVETRVPSLDEAFGVGLHYRMTMPL